jgi:hypothetical protein
MMGLGAFTTAGSYGRVLGLGGFVMGLAQCIYIKFYVYPYRPYIVHSCTNECLYQTVRTFVCTKLYEHLFVPNCMTKNPCRLWQGFRSCPARGGFAQTLLRKFPAMPRRFPVPAAVWSTCIASAAYQPTGLLLGPSPA